jgi:peptidoglycan L-alanyl-D-glutamate endopeptidase CwlK
VSAGTSNAVAVVSRDPQLLAPKFRVAVDAALADCAAGGLDAFVYEAYRSGETQAIYFARGRTVVPPTRPVTNASSNLFSWHGYGLAVDVISRSREWDVPLSWYEAVAECFKAHGCRWGGDWVMKDLPHFQWGPCRPSPSDRARELIATGGLEAVWEAVGAL